jgi:lipoprotein NlpI
MMPEQQEYQRFFIWVTAMRMGQKEADVNKALADFMEKRNTGRPRDWAARIGDFLIDKTPEAEFIASAASRDAKTDRGQKCEAYYYAGVKRLVKNDRTGAADLFAKCVATGEKDFIEFRFARAELKALGK